tara:strand:- start:900 stop:1094 length:195 start_codon:yes stop_codon:yes gene_type:complete
MMPELVMVPARIITDVYKIEPLWIRAISGFWPHFGGVSSIGKFGLGTFAAKWAIDFEHNFSYFL